MRHLQSSFNFPKTDKCHSTFNRVSIDERHLTWGTSAEHNVVTLMEKEEVIEEIHKTMEQGPLIISVRSTLTLRPMF